MATNNSPSSTNPLYKVVPGVLQKIGGVVTPPSSSPLNGGGGGGRGSSSSGNNYQSNANNQAQQQQALQQAQALAQQQAQQKAQAQQIINQAIYNQQSNANNQFLQAQTIRNANSQPYLQREFTGKNQYDSVVTYNQGSFKRPATAQEIKDYNAQESAIQLQKTDKSVNRKVSAINTKLLRGETLTAKEQAQNILYNAEQAPISLYEGAVAIPGIVKSVITNPKQTLASIKDNRNGGSISETIRNNPIGTTARVGSEIALGFGISKGISAGSKLAVESLGYPKLSTTFVSKQLAQQGDESLLSFKAVTQKKNLFGNNVYYSAGVTNVKTFPIVDTNQPFTSVTKAIAREKVINLGTGKAEFNKNFLIGGKAKGIITKQDLSLVTGQGNGLTTGGQLSDAYTIRSVGQTGTRRINPSANKFYGKPVYQKYAGVGFGADVPGVDNVGLINSKTFPYTKANGVIKFTKGGKGTSIGVFKKESTPDVFGSFFSNDLKVGTNTKFSSSSIA
ncbi:MAG: hypothetical protein WCJ18_08205, partial [Planctomycetota bacterium]